MGWHTPEYDPRVDGMADYDSDRPSASDLAEEAWENSRKRNYPRGYGPPLEGEDEPSYMDPEGASLETIDPDRYLQEEDIPHAPQAESFGAPIHHLRTPGADYPDETDPAEWEDREEEYAHENLRGHFGKQAPLGGILTQANQWPDRVAANRPVEEPRW